MSTSPPPTAEKPEKQDRKTFAAFKIWLHERKTWLRERNWEGVTGHNGALRAAAVTGSLGLVLAFWLLGSWIYRSTRPQTEESQINQLATSSVELPPLTEPLPNLQVSLDQPEPQQEFQKPLIAVSSKAKEPLQLAATEPDPLPNPPAHAEPKPIAPAGLSDPFAADAKAEVTPEAPIAPKEQPESTVFEKQLVLQKPAPKDLAPESPVREPLNQSSPDDQPIANKPAVEKPADEKVDTEPVEPVVPVDEKPRVLAEKAAAPPVREEESFSGQEGRVAIERGTAIVPTAASPEAPPVADAEPPFVKPAAPVSPPAPPADELPIRTTAEPPAIEVKPEPQPESAPPAIKKEKADEPTLRDDEPFGASTPDKPPQSPPVAPEKPVEDKPEIEKGADNKLPENPPQKVEPSVAEPPITTPSTVEKPMPEKPSVVEPAPSTATSPFPDDPPASANPPAPPNETRPAPVKKDEEADVAALPEKREPRPEPPAPDRLPHKPPETTVSPSPAIEKPVAEPAPRQRPESPRAPEGVTTATLPQIDFELTAPLQAKRGATIEIGFKVTNIGPADIDGLVFSIRLPASLKHRAGRDVEYRIDRLAAGQSHAAQMRVTAENAEVALIRAEMAAGRYRLATSDRQINVHGTSPTGFIQRTSAEVPAPQQPRPQFLPWSMQMGGWRPCDCEGP